MSGIKERSGGHNRKILREKQLLGVVKKARLVSGPEVIKGAMMIFDDIGENGKKLREQFLPMLQNNGTLSVSYSVAFHKFCRAAEEWFKYDKMCLERGRMIPLKTVMGIFCQWKFLHGIKLNNH